MGPRAIAYHVLHNNYLSSAISYRFAFQLSFVVSVEKGGAHVKSSLRWKRFLKKPPSSEPGGEPIEKQKGLSAQAEANE